jgi:hypothetical protein
MIVEILPCSGATGCAATSEITVVSRKASAFLSRGYKAIFAFSSPLS